MNENTIPVQETDKPNGFPPVLFSFPLFMFYFMWTHMHVWAHAHTHTSWTYESISNSICCVVALKRKNLVMNYLGSAKTPLRITGDIEV